MPPAKGFAGKQTCNPEAHEKERKNESGCRPGAHDQRRLELLLDAILSQPKVALSTERRIVHSEQDPQAAKIAATGKAQNLISTDSEFDLVGSAPIDFHNQPMRARCNREFLGHPIGDSRDFYAVTHHSVVTPEVCVATFS